MGVDFQANSVAFGLISSPDRKVRTMEIATRCAVCDSLGNSREGFPSTVDANSFTAEVFSARRLPDRRHYRWVTCNNCGMYRSDPVSDINLDDLYRNSSFDYSGEVHGLKNSYRKIVAKTCANPRDKDLIEIGGGNGFFLEEALDMGFKTVREVEPSVDARDQAPEHLKQYFITDMLRPNLIPSESADVAVIFHVLDHLPDPLDTLKLILETLKPGGSICIAVHNVKSISATLLRSKSPIFDVEHTYLYSKKTLKLLLEKAGYSEIEIRHYKNSYSLAYLFHLLPLSRRFKSKLLNSNYGQLLRRVRLTVPLGNMWAVARKL